MIIKTEKGEITLVENIIQISLKEDIHLLLSDLKEINAAKRELIGNQSHALLIITGPGATVSKEVLQMLCKNDPLGNITSKAIVANSVAKKYINTWFKNHSAGQSVNAFDSIEEALMWLKTR